MSETKFLDSSASRGVLEKGFIALLVIFSFSVLANAVTVEPRNWFPDSGAVVSNPFVFEVRCFVQDGSHGGQFYESLICQCQALHAPSGGGTTKQVTLYLRTDHVYRSNPMTLTPGNYNVGYLCFYGTTSGGTPQFSFTVTSTPSPSPSPLPSPSVLPSPSPSPTPPVNRYLNASKAASPLWVLIGQNITVAINFTGTGIPSSVRRYLDSMLTLDISGTMNGPKLRNATFAGQVFVESLNSSIDKVGLVSFNESAYLNNQLTDNFWQVNNSLESLNQYVNGLTDIGDAINASSNELASIRGRPSALKVIVLLTDGMPNVPYGDPQGNPTPESYAYVIAAASAAANANQSIYVIGLGVDGVNLNETFLRQVAAIGGGKYYNTTNAAQLAAIFLNISVELLNSAATRISVVDVIPANVDFQGPVPYEWPHECDYEAASKKLKCFRGSIALGESWLISFNVSTESHGRIPTNAQCAYSYIAANGSQQSGSLLSPIVYVARPRALLVAQPSWGYGPFDSVLNASFYDLPEGSYRAEFDCGNGQSGQTPFQVSSPQVWGGETLANASFNCSYPLVAEPPNQDYKANVNVSYGPNGPGGPNHVYDETWISDYPRSLGIRDAAPVNGALVPASSVEFKATCYSDEINDSKALADCDCWAYYWSGSNTTPNPVHLRLAYSIGGASGGEPYYHETVQNLPIATFYEYFNCSRRPLSVQTPTWFFNTYGGPVPLVVLTANPSTGTGIFRSNLTATFSNMTISPNNVLLDCLENPLQTIPMLQVSAFVYTENCTYPNVTSTRTYQTRVSAVGPKVEALSAIASVTDNPTPTPPTPPSYPPGVSFLSAVCPTSLVLGSSTNVTGFLVVNGTPTCLIPPNIDNWQFNLTYPNSTISILGIVPQSGCVGGNNVFIVGTPDKGRYTVDLVAYPNDPLLPEIISLSSSCSFTVLPNPPSQFPDVPLIVVVLAALGVFVYLARYNKKKK